MRKIYLLTLLSVLFMACSSDDDPTVEPVKVTKIEIADLSSNIYVGGSHTLEVSHSPADIDAPAYTWTSSNENVLTVDQNGTITALTVGVAKVTASVAQTNLSSSIEITVKPIDATSITLDASSKELLIGEGFKLTATVQPENVTSKDISWSSSNPAVATVNAGEVIAVSVGTASIVASIGNLTTECVVEVKAIPITAIILNETQVSLYPNEERTLSVSVEPNNAVLPNFVWSSSNPAVATVENGVVKSIVPGTSTITVKTQDGNFEAHCAVTVKAIELTGISLSSSNIQIPEGVMASLYYTITPEDANDVVVTATSSDSSVATYDPATKKVTTHKAGTATITVTASAGVATYSATCTVMVQSIIDQLELRTRAWTAGSVNGYTQASDVTLTFINKSSADMSDVKYAVRYRDDQTPITYVNVGVIAANNSEISKIDRIDGLDPYFVIKFTVAGKEYTKEEVYDFMK